MQVPSKKSTKGGLALTVISRNEEAVIGRCLDSVRDLVSEMIVVDTGSMDRTPEISEARGARVLQFHWSDDFAAARNAALDAASAPWILVLDADEYLAPDSRQLLVELVSAEPDCAYRILNRSMVEGSGRGVLGRMVRLFPNLPVVRYEWPVHEQVEESLQRARICILNSDVEVLHTGYSSAAVNRAKQERNLRIMDAELARNGFLPPMLQFLRGGALLDLGQPERALDAYAVFLDRHATGSQLEAAARVRRATCLDRMERWQELLKLAPEEPTVSWHPELLLCLGKAALKTGNLKSGVEWLHAVLAVPPADRIPACDDVRVMIQALMTLAEFVQTRNPAKAVKLMRLAVNANRSGNAPSLEDVIQVYQDIDRSCTT
jgi:hypothetical protein